MKLRTIIPIGESMLEIETRDHLSEETAFEELVKILGHINDPSAEQMLEAIKIRKTNMV